MFKKALWLLFVLSVSTLHAADPSSTPRLNQNFFIENKGQWQENVLFLAKLNGVNIWITRTGIVYDYYVIKNSRKEGKEIFEEKIRPDASNDSVRGDVLSFEFINARPVSEIETGEMAEGYFNYIIGNDPGRWASYVRRYGSVVLKNIYPGIDVVYTLEDGKFRYDFRIQPGADVSVIAFNVEGAEALNVSNTNELEIKTSLGLVKHGNIYAYQSRRGIKQPVHCRFYNKSEKEIGLVVNDYDISRELVIDPLVYSTYLGGPYNYDEGCSKCDS